jgi:hypothetical protein
LRLRSAMRKRLQASFYAQLVHRVRIRLALISGERWPPARHCRYDPPADRAERSAAKSGHDAPALPYDVGSQAGSRWQPHACGTYPGPSFCLVSAICPIRPGDTSGKSDCLRAVTHQNAKVFE